MFISHSLCCYNRATTLKKKLTENGHSLTGLIETADRAKGKQTHQVSQAEKFFRENLLGKIGYQRAGLVEDGNHWPYFPKMSYLAKTP